ncbi:hypothetical protein I302_104307 [Kwoniella bestiolae CBS 10118]|uniref:Uncharacterized protein n=1 Tax=Kwoniella bestiolae CBS 10118 TaxID=1296100 RepID=A0A1B9GAW8_9TREE|nr:hypothetical protein I302_03014 [Kwoniella bestiolae CBS 10118]OCF28163.1 hypothetical protein I302_03014 [Kwoniella bestiolae CBS 10118]
MSAVNLTRFGDLDLPTRFVSLHYGIDIDEQGKAVLSCEATAWRDNNLVVDETYRSDERQYGILASELNENLVDHWDGIATKARDSGPTDEFWYWYLGELRRLSVETNGARTRSLALPIRLLNHDEYFELKSGGQYSESTKFDRTRDPPAGIEWSQTTEARIEDWLGNIE